MYCSSCGTNMAGVQMRCPECKRHTPPFWLNLTSLCILAVVIAMNHIFFLKLLPHLANLLAELGAELTLVMRLQFALMNFTRISIMFSTS